MSYPNPPYNQGPSHYPPAGSYPQQGPGGYQAPSNGTGTAALVLGILSLLCFGLFAGIPAVILGFIGKGKAERGEATNRGAALAGLILGAIGTVLSIAGLIFFLSTASSDETNGSDGVSSSESGLPGAPGGSVTEVPAPTEGPEAAPPLGGSAGQENARQAADNYLEFSGFSRSSLIGQLEFEGYATEDATWGVDSLNVDWNGQAVRSAKQYLDAMPFSREDLIQQLEFEGYTLEQAEYGVSQAGYSE